MFSSINKKNKIRGKVCFCFEKKKEKASTWKTKFNPNLFLKILKEFKKYILDETKNVYEHKFKLGTATTAKDASYK